LLPLFAALDRPDALRKQMARLQAHPPAADAYYEQALTLFGLGWQEGRFSFAADGSLAPTPAPCPPIAGRP
jgi:endoglucanase